MAVVLSDFGGTPVADADVRLIDFDPARLDELGPPKPVIMEPAATAPVSTEGPRCRLMIDSWARATVPDAVAGAEMTISTFGPEDSTNLTRRSGSGRGRWQGIRT